VQKDQSAKRDSPRGLRCPECGGGGATTATGGSRTTALAGNGAAGVARALSWGRSAPGSPVEMAGGSKGREDRRRRAIAEAAELTRGGGERDRWR
jgi:hypothetical protein